ncbi:MAG: glutamate 5-kinase [bacterium]|nr:glutamate 5-kinase [bacterium]
MGRKLIVVKVGSSILQDENGCLDYAAVQKITKQLLLIRNEYSLVVVSSGAIATGMSRQKLLKRPKELAKLQALAAIGQPKLISAYDLFVNDGPVAQLLVSYADFHNPKSSNNFKNTIEELIGINAFIVVNENDSTATEEISFGDNDILAATVAVLLSADQLVLVTNVSGFADEFGDLISEIKVITPYLTRLASLTDSQFRVGGMISKLKAGEIAMAHKISTYIISGKEDNRLVELVLEHKRVGTRFVV